MKAPKTICFFLLSCLLANSSFAQLEGAYLHSKTFKAIGYGGHLNFSFPVTDAASLTTEAGIYLFKKEDNNVVVTPILLGYQYTVDGSGTGFFVEPLAGYTFGATDIQVYDENDSPVTDPNNPGEWLEQQAKGPTAGLATGYIFRGDTPVTLGVRYERIFVSGNPALNLIGLRVTWPLFGGKRD